MKPRFSEKQKFTQWWLRLILIGIAVLGIYGVVQQIIFNVPFGNNPAPDGVLIAFLIGALLLNFFLLSIQLCTEMDEKQIRVSFGFLLKKRVDWSSVESAEIIDYGFIGGWGVRYAAKYGWVYSTGGSEGLKLILKNGKKIIVGTQKKVEMEEFLKGMKSRGTKE